jgi:hypothetical protein
LLREILQKSAGFVFILWWLQYSTK